MHDLERKMIEFGAIDTTIESIQIDEWFKNATITYLGRDDIGNVICGFEDCYEISLKHDMNYKKGIQPDGNLDYKYFIQDISIDENNGFYFFKVSAWPLEGLIICKNIEMKFCKS